MNQNSNSSDNGTICEEEIDSEKKIADLFWRYLEPEQAKKQPIGAQKPDKMYHYTGADALQSIIRKVELPQELKGQEIRSLGYIRLSDVRFLNDVSEMLYGFHIISDCLKQKRMNQSLKKAIREKTEELISQYAGTKEMKADDGVYVASFCMKGDVLNMWNYYTRADKQVGYCIEFDPGKFFIPHDNLTAPYIMLYKPVIYEERQQKEFANRFLDIFSSAFKDAAKGYSKTALLNPQGCFMTFISCFLIDIAIFIKHPAFKEEHEFRIAVSSISPKNIQLRVKDGVFLPYLEMLYDRESVKGITVSPALSAFPVEIGLKQLLDKEKLPSCEIKKSEIPLRF